MDQVGQGRAWSAWLLHFAAALSFSRLREVSTGYILPLRPLVQQCRLALGLCFNGQQAFIKHEHGFLLSLRPNTQVLQDGQHANSWCGEMLK